MNKSGPHRYNAHVGCGGCLSVSLGSFDTVKEAALAVNIGYELLIAAGVCAKPLEAVNEVSLSPGDRASVLAVVKQRVNNWLSVVHPGPPGSCTGSVVSSSLVRERLGGP